MTKAPTPTEMSKRESDNTKNATKKFDYTSVADRLRTVSWSNYSHPTGVVNLVYGPRNSIQKHLKAFTLVSHPMTDSVIFETLTTLDLAFSYHISSECKEKKKK